MVAVCFREGPGRLWFSSTFCSRCRDLPYISMHTVVAHEPTFCLWMCVLAFSEYQIFRISRLDPRDIKPGIQLLGCPLVRRFTVDRTPHLGPIDYPPTENERILRHPNQTVRSRHCRFVDADVAPAAFNERGSFFRSITQNVHLLHLSYVVFFNSNLFCCSDFRFHFNVNDGATHSLTPVARPSDMYVLRTHGTRCAEMHLQ